MDNVSFSPGPLPLLEGRTVGFSATQGTHTEAGGVFTMSGSADGINGTSDDFYFVSAPVDRRLHAHGARHVAAKHRQLRRRPACACAKAPAVACARFIWRQARTSRRNWPGATLRSRWPMAWAWTSASLPGMLTFAPGIATQSITLDIVNDARPEPDEPVTIILRNAHGARLGNATFTYLIVDDDAASALPFAGFAAAASSAVEASGTVLVPVTLSAPATATVTVDYAITAGTATADVDFTAATGTLTFNPGDTVQHIPLTLLDDAVIEAERDRPAHAVKSRGLLTNTLEQHTFTILDDDTPGGDDFVHGHQCGRNRRHGPRDADPHRSDQQRAHGQPHAHRHRHRGHGLHRHQRHRGHSRRRSEPHAHAHANAGHDRGRHRNRHHHGGGRHRLYRGRALERDELHRR